MEALILKSVRLCVYQMFKFGPKITFIVKCDKQSLSPAYSYFVRRGLKWGCVLFWNAAGHGAQMEPQVSEVGEGTVTRFRVISPSGDWLARDWRMVMDSRMDWVFWTCCSAHGRVICGRHTRQQQVKEPPGRILKFTLVHFNPTLSSFRVIDLLEWKCLKSRHFGD